MKHIAFRALVARYGFGPKLDHITLLEASDEGHYIMIDVAGHQYQIVKDAAGVVEVIEYA